MKVTLIDFTGKGSSDECWYAAHLLIYTKSTRLGLRPDLLEEIQRRPAAELRESLTYMANTIPSSWEFVSYTFLVEDVSRAYTHQQVRTRAASYAQQSLRVVENGDFDYVYTRRNLQDTKAFDLITRCLGTIKETYRELVKIGQPVEDARGILPTNISTNIICKFNMRTFVEMFNSRSGGRTQHEYQDVVRRMASAVLEVHPWMTAFLLGGRRPDYFDEIEQFAEAKFGGDLAAKGELLKIVDKMRKAGDEGKTLHREAQ